MYPMSNFSGSLNMKTCVEYALLLLLSITPGNASLPLLLQHTQSRTLKLHPEIRRVTLNSLLKLQGDVVTLL